MAGRETLSSHAEGRSLLRDRLKRLSDRTPLRTKLITAVLILVIMALTAIAVASTYMLRSYLVTRHDQDLRQTVNGVSWNNHVFGANLLPSGNVVAIQQPGKQITWAQYDNFQVYGPDLSEGPLPALPTSKNWASPTNWVLMTLPSQSGPETWRVIASTQTIWVSIDGVPQLAPATLVVAVDLGNINAVTARLVIFDTLVGGAIVLVLAAVAVAVVRANLRPLDDIELTAGQIAAGHLDHRVPEGDPRTEVGSLSRSLNAMLAQIERAFHAQGQAEQSAHQSEERMRRFIADAAHELRTPLTTIRGFAAHYRLRGGASGLRPEPPVPANAAVAGTAEGTAAVNSAGGAEQHPASRTDSAFSVPASSANGGAALDGLSPGELDRLMSRVESEAMRMGVLVEDLLTLARLDQQRPITKAPVDLLTLAADAVQDARIVSPGRPIELIVAPGTAFLVDGDEPRLRQVLANLVNNALTHTPDGTPLRVKIARGTVEASGSPGPAGAGELVRTAGTSDTGADAPTVPAVVPAVVLDVEDDGPGMTVEQAQRVFERFYRADAARSRASGGTGLGLAIVAGLVSAHGGTVAVKTAPGKGADFQVKLPLSPDALPLDDSDSDSDSDSDDLAG